MTASTLISDYIGVGPIADRPATPSVGTGVEAFYYATDTSVQYAWNGSAWVALGGSIEVTNGTTTLTGVTTLTISSGITLTGSGSNGTLTASGGGGGGSSLAPNVGVALSRPALASLTVTNLGTNTATDVSGGGPIAIQATETGSVSLITFGESVSGSSWTRTILVEEQVNASGSSQGTGIYAKDGSGLMVCMLHLPGSNGFYFFNCNSNTSIAGSASSIVSLFNVARPLWMKMQLSSGNFIFSYSVNGLLFDVLATFSASGFMGTPVETGMMLSCQNSGYPATACAYIWAFS